MYAEIRGIRLYYEIIGSGRPLVMLHGNGEDHTIFQEAAEVLSRQFACYLIDTRDHGKSTPVKELHYPDMAEDVIAFLEAKDLKDVVLYGFSDGGIVGLLTCMKTDRVSDLIISGANLSPDAVIGPIGLMINVMGRFSKDEKIRLMLREPNIDPEDLRAIRARTLVLAGEHDVVRKSETERIAAYIPNAYLRILPAEGHGSYTVHTRRIADILLGWLNRENERYGI
jgi:pimeloyl-ACP methyl ester carboxylesterase